MVTGLLSETPRVVKKKKKTIPGRIIGRLADGMPHRGKVPPRSYADFDKSRVDESDVAYIESRRKELKAMMHDNSDVVVT
jgi:hypothetical protein